MIPETATRNIRMYRFSPESMIIREDSFSPSPVSDNMEITTPAMAQARATLIIFLAASRKIPIAALGVTRFSLLNQLATRLRPQQYSAALLVDSLSTTSIYTSTPMGRIRNQLFLSVALKSGSWLAGSPFIPPLTATRWIEMSTIK